MHRFTAPFSGRVDVIGSRNRFPTGAAGPVVETMVFEPAVAGAPDDPFNLTDEFEQGSQELALELSFYATFDDVAVAAPDDLIQAPDGAIDSEESFDLSLYQQVDDDPVAAPDTLLASIEAPFDQTADEAADASFYSTTADDAAAIPDTLLGSFDFIEDTARFGDDEAASFYHQQDDDPVIVLEPPSTGAGGIFAPAGNTYVIPARRDTQPRDHYIPIKREPFEVKLKPAKDDLKVLRDRLFDLGRLLEHRKQAVKDRIKAEKAQALSPDMSVILQILIDEYQLELHNQNAARLLIILAEDR